MDGCRNVSYLAHESMMARFERVIRRLWVLLLILIILLVGTNAAWLVYESQFETVSTEMDVEQENESGDNYAVGGDYSG